MFMLLIVSGVVGFFGWVMVMVMIVWDGGVGSFFGVVVILDGK